MGADGAGREREGAAGAIVDADEVVAGEGGETEGTDENVAGGDTAEAASGASAGDSGDEALCGTELLRAGLS